MYRRHRAYQVVPGSPAVGIVFLRRDDGDRADGPYVVGLLARHRHSTADPVPEDDSAPDGRPWPSRRRGRDPCWLLPSASGRR